MNTKELNRGMRSRHLAMIAIGGTISASFFMGIGDIIHQVGTFGTVIGYIIGGLVMFLTLLSLAEMAIALPVSGSFQEYATRFISPLAGFCTGWLYLINWITAAAASITAASIIMTSWFSGVEPWMWSILFIVIIAAMNFFPVKAYGEIEFWFAGIKILAIIIFIIIATAIALGFVPNFGPIVGFKSFTEHGLFPNGLTPFFYGIVIIVCTYQGAELVGIAAGESEDPEKNIRSAIRNVGLRILLFFVISVFLISIIEPWQNLSVTGTPFITILAKCGIPHIDTIMQIVIVISCLSAVNSAFYASARLLWSMANDKQAPQIYAKVNKNSVPFVGVIVTAGLSGLCLISKFVGAEKVFMLIISSSGMVGCLVWLMIAWSHIGFRKYLTKTGQSPTKLAFRVRPFPLVPILGIVANAIIILGMLIDPDQRTVVYSGVLLLIFFIIVYHGWFKKEASHVND